MKRKIVMGVGIASIVIVSVVAITAFYIVGRLKGLDVEGSYFDSDGVRIHYCVEGEGVPVILVHGLGATIGANWSAPGVLQRLAQHYKVIALDSRGHGKSDKPHDPAQYGVEMAEDVVRLMDCLGIEKAHVVGYSMGGFIVIKLMTTHPERLLSAAPCGAGWAREPERDLGFLDVLADDLEQGRGFGALLERLQPVGKPVGRAKRMAVDAAMRAGNDLQALTAALRGMRELRVTEADLRNNKVPCLAIIGARDPLKIFADRLAEVTGNIDLVVVPEANHFSTVGNQCFVEALEAFFAAHAPQAAAVSWISFPRYRCAANLQACLSPS